MDRYYRDPLVSGSDFSEVLQPRRQPPPGRNVQSVARVQPMVPEVSAFQPSVVQTVDSKQPELTIKPLRRPPGDPNDEVRGEVSGPKESPGDPNDEVRGEVSGPKESPVPAAAPSLRLTSEFSKMFLDSSVSMLPPSPSESHPEREHRRPSIPDDVREVLKWQNDQLVRLQDQVKRLLSTRPEGSPSAPPVRNVAEASTQTSAPCSPRRKEMPNPIEDVSILQINERHEEVAGPPTVSSPAASGSEGIVCRDLRPPENIRAILRDFDEGREGSGAEGRVPAAVEPSIFGRLRDMGVSFIRPSDIRPPKGTAGEEVSTWHPTAAEPGFVSSTESTSDYSLMLNSAALKYLDDEQLTRVAKRNSGSNLGGRSSFTASTAEASASPFHR